MKLLEKKYQERYTNDPIFQNEYIHFRTKVYRKISEIAENLKIKSLLDIGCSYGLLVDICNARGIDTFGFDLPIDSLKQFHQKLEFSKDKFIYGSIDDEAVFHSLGQKGFEAVTIIDSLRYFEHPEFIRRINARFLIIKEVSDNLYIRRQRKKVETIPDHRLYSPTLLLDVFNKYKALRIYLPKFILRVNNPGQTALKVINYLPTYTIVLQRKDR